MRRQLRDGAANPSTVGIKGVCLFVSLAETFVPLYSSHHKILTVEQRPAPTPLTGQKFILAMLVRV